MNSGNAKLAATVISTALELGVNHFVICAGARNVPLIADLRERKNIHIWTHFDERSAAFFALGLSKAHGQPTAVVTTSGTAVAELFPSTIEAWYAGLPLVLITADRPVRFRGSGAPQAIEQCGIFSGFVGQFLDLERGSEENQAISWNRQSPLHINVCFEEPCIEPPEDASSLNIYLDKIDREAQIKPQPTLVNPIALVGELSKEHRQPVTDFLKATGIPSWFEATSGIREHPELAGQRIADDSHIAAIAPKKVIRIGAVPSLRFWRDLEEQEAIQIVNITDSDLRGLGRTQNVDIYTFSKLKDLKGCISGVYPVRSMSVQGTLDQKLKAHPRSEPALISELSQLIPSTAAVFLGNSMPIRQWNLAASFEIPHPRCFANRGANGIDGEVSSFLGISQNFEESWGIFGDLTALYDLNAPWILNQLPEGRRYIVVLNNGGGRIFSRLPAMQNITSIAENHHDTNFSGWAELWKMAYYQWTDDPDQWTIPKEDHALIEIRIDQKNNELFWDSYNS